MPMIERSRRGRADLNKRPMSDERECDLPVRQWTAHDEVIVAMHQNTYSGTIISHGSILAFAVRIACTSFSASSTEQPAR